MNEASVEDEEYLGDGLYASFDGYQICLRAPREGGSHIVYLDGHTYAALIDYVRRITGPRAATAGSSNQ